MSLSDEETNVLDLIAKYSFLLDCRDEGYITEEKDRQIHKSLGLKNKLMIQYFLERLTEHKKDMVKFVDQAQGRFGGRC